MEAVMDGPALESVVHARIRWQGKECGPTPSNFRAFDVMPTAEHPFGQKGLLLTRIWQVSARVQSSGMLILDADCAIDPLDYSAMIISATTEPDVVWTAPVRLWPASTAYHYWVWGHREVLTDRDPPLSNEEARKIWQSDIDDPTMFTFNFTYLPRRLIEACIRSDMATWVFPHVDEYTWQEAREAKIPVRVVRRGCAPKHLHY
jgi:hypothetical protein